MTLLTGRADMALMVPAPIMWPSGGWPAREVVRRPIVPEVTS